MDLFRSKVKFPQKSVYFEKKSQNPPKNTNKPNNLNPKPQVSKIPEESKSHIGKNTENHSNMSKPQNILTKPPEKPINIIPKTPDNPHKNQEKLIKDAQNAFEAVKNTISLLLEADQEGKNPL